MSVDDDIDHIAFKDKFHREIDNIPKGARVALIWENHCKENCGEKCEGKATILISEKSTWRDILYMSELLRNS